MKTKTFIVSDIQWDTDGQDVVLPEEMEITVTDKDVENLDDEWEVSDFICDQITEETGFCHSGYTITEKQTKKL